MNKFSTILLLTLLIAVSNLVAQPIKRVEAYKHLQEGNLEDARRAIDVAVINTETKDQSETWYLRAFIYNEYYKKQDSDNPFSTFKIAAENSCKECIVLDKTPNNEWGTECLKIYDQIAVNYYNNGVKNYQENNFRDAFKLFNRYLTIYQETFPNKIDINALFLTGYSAYNFNDYESAKNFFLKAKRKGAGSFELYYYLAKTYWLLDDRQSAFSILVEGNEKHPKRKEIIELHLNYLQEAGDVVEKEHILQKALKLDPQNVQYMVLLAIHYESIAESFIGEPNYDLYLDKAKNYYEQAIAVDSNHLLSNYNLGLLYYNRGVTMANELDENADILTIFEVQDKVTSLFKQALPYMIKSFELNPKRRDTIIALDNIYSALNNPEEAKKYQELLKAQ